MSQDDYLRNLCVEVQTLTVENARLRDIQTLVEARRKELAKWANECGRLCERLTAVNARLRADLEFARASCARSETERDNAIATFNQARVAAKAAGSSLLAVAQWTDADGDMMALRSYARSRAAVALAACAPEVKP